MIVNDQSPLTTSLSQLRDTIFSLLGQYWQVSDGPSSSLTIDTAEVPLGSYSMDIVIYHYRSKQKFIPLGYASTQFSITGTEALKTNTLYTKIHKQALSMSEKKPGCVHIHIHRHIPRLEPQVVLIHLWSFLR